MSKYLLLLIPLFLLHAIKRERETDRQGNPTLRFYGPALAVFTIGVLFIYLAYRPLLGIKEFSATGDESSALSFSAICFLIAIFFFFSKTVLTEKSIVVNYLVFKFHYDLKDFIRTEEDRFVIFHFSGNRRFGVLPFCSGQEYFIERMLALTTQSR